MSSPLYERDRSTKTHVRLSAQAGGSRSRYGRGSRVPAGSHPHRGYAPLLTRSVGCFGKTRWGQVSLKLVIYQKSTPRSGKAWWAAAVFDGGLPRALTALGALVGAVKARYGACPKNETCAFSEGLTHHCTGAGGVGYEKILDWPPWKEPLPTRSWLTIP